MRLKHQKADGFSISASYGWANDVEAGSSTSEILTLADRRMYADKHSGRPSAASQSADVLAKALRERNPELSVHLDKVAHLAREVAGIVAALDTRSSDQVIVERH
jgi:hypothetical protein